MVQLLAKYGDGVANINIQTLLEFHKNHNKTLTITGVNAPSRFGELIEKDGKVQSFIEKPQMSVGIVNGGYMVFNRNLLDYLNEDQNCDFEFGSLQKIASEKQLKAYEDYWVKTISKNKITFLFMFG